MLDITNIVNRGNNIQTFTSAGTWQTWVKPRGAKTVDILCIGGGAGGAGGFAANVNVNGGTGGGSSAFTKAIFNANTLPNILYVYVGPGGKGGIGQVYGGSPPDNSLTSGSISYVTVTPNTGSTSAIICRSGNAASPGTAGGGTVATAAQMVLINLSTNYTTVAGQNSVTPISSQTNITPVTIITAGMAGNLTTSTGTAGETGINSAGPIPGISSSIVGTSINAHGKKGGDGYTIYKPIFASVGGGGGTSTPSSSAIILNGIGGYGGNGSYGCGGGGGGSSFQGAGGPTATGGNGGNGGNGIVIITTTC
jgi:hypothetical protein